MSYDVREKTIPDLLVASVTTETDLNSVGPDIRAGFGRLLEVLGQAGATLAGPPLVIYLDMIDADTRGRIEACAPVGAPFEESDGIRCKTLEGGRVASTVHQGAYHEIGSAYQAISTWMGAHGWGSAGPPREIYINDPAEVPVSELLTEVVWPIRKVG